MSGDENAPGSIDAFGNSANNYMNGHDNAFEPPSQQSFFKSLSMDSKPSYIQNGTADNQNLSRNNNEIMHQPNFPPSFEQANNDTNIINSQHKPPVILESLAGSVAKTVNVGRR